MSLLSLFNNLFPGETRASNEVCFKRLSDTAVMPTYATPGSAGMDLHADADVQIAIGERKLVPTNIAIALPAHLEAQIRSRSGLALKNGVHVLNSPGTIDPDYRGSLGVVLYNAGNETFLVRAGDRIAQIVFAPFARVNLQPVEWLDTTVRGAGGFGSTGIKQAVRPRAVAFTGL
jgi:dUTP pyrophosphatase